MSASPRERAPSPEPVYSWEQLNPEKAEELRGGAHFQPPLQVHGSSDPAQSLPLHGQPEFAYQTAPGQPMVFVPVGLPLFYIVPHCPDSPVGSGTQSTNPPCPPGSASTGFLPDAAQASTASTASSNKEGAAHADDPDSENGAPGTAEKKRKKAMNKPNARNSSQILQQPLKYELAPEASADGSFTRSDIHLHSPVKSQEPEHSIGHIESWFAAGAADATVEVKAKCALRVDRCCERGYFPNCGTQVQLLEQFLVQAMGTKHLSKHRNAQRHTTIQEGWLQTADDQQVRLIFQAYFVEDDAEEADIDDSPSQQELIRITVDDDAFKTLRRSSIDSSRHDEHGRTSWSLSGTKEGFCQLSECVVSHMRKDASPFGTLRESADGKKLKYDLPILDQQLPGYLPGCICYVRSLRRDQTNDQSDSLKVLHNKAVVLLEHPQTTGDLYGRCRVGRWVDGFKKKVYKIGPQNLFVGAMRGATLEEELAKFRFWDVRCFMDEGPTGTVVTLCPPEMKNGVWYGKCRVQKAGEQIGCKNIILVEPESIRFDHELARVNPSRGKKHTASEAQRSALTEYSEPSRMNAQK